MSDALSTEPLHDTADGLNAVRRLQAVIDGWDAGQRETVAAYRGAIEALNAEAFRRMIRAVKAEPAGLAALQHVAGDEVVYGVLRHHGLIRPSLQETVEAALQSVRPMLASHGGDVELVRVIPPGTVEIRFIGACESCPASAMTFHAGVEKAIHEHCPAITNIIQVKGLGHASPADTAKMRFISPFTIADGGIWVSVCNLGDIPAAGPLFTLAEGHKIILARSARGVACYQNACAHMGWALDGGSVADGILTCPWHGFRYDLATGECLTAPDVQLHAHAVRVVGDRVEVRLVE